jgi:acetyltransferase
MESKEMKAIDSLFHPSSIAVIGASEKTMYGKGILEYLMQFGYTGRIFPVNPKRDQILGIKAYPRLGEIAEPIDTALIVVGRNYVLDSLKECAEKRVKSAIIISAGFQEADDKGKQLEKEISRFAQKTGLRICGPNCAGLVNMKDKILISLLREEGRELLSGDVGFVSQSGALMMALAGVAQDKGIGLSYIVSTGNEADLEVSDFMKYMIEDPDTRVITAFVEGFKDVHKFSQVAELSLKKKKPIIILKVGRSELGKEAAASHTAHLTGSDSAYDALFKQKGVIRAIDTDELFGMAKIFSHGRSPKGDGVAILTSSGGTGSLTADLCGDLGINLPEIKGSTLDELLAIEGLLTFGKLGNPADIRGQGMGIIKNVLPPLLRDKEYSIILICLAFSTVGPGLAQQIAPTIVELSKTTDKPIVVLWIGRRKKGALTERDCGFDVLEQNGIPVYDKPITCLSAIKALIDWSRLQSSKAERPVLEGLPLTLSKEDIAKVSGTQKGALDEYESKKLISLYGIPVTKEKLATSVQEAKSIAGEIGYPVALKVMSADIAHKTDAGIIKLNVDEEVALEKSYNEIIENAGVYNSNAAIRGVLVQEMLQGGIEVILGMSQDPQFGPIIMFGLGGIFVEVLKDVSFRIPPLTKSDAEEMIRELKGYRILEGVRGSKARDTESLIDILVRFSHLSLNLEDRVAELDINPLVVFEKGMGARALDALVVLK